MSFSLDVNILLYATDTSSPFHQPASAFLDRCIQGSELFYLGWPTVMGFLRIATHGSVCSQPLTPAQAMSNVEALLDLPHTRFLTEGDRVLGGLSAHRWNGAGTGQPRSRCPPGGVAAGTRRQDALYPRPRLSAIRLPRCTRSVRLTPHCPP